MLKELELAIRSATRNPGFLFVAALTLAAGIGVNGALFSLLDAVFLRPLPLRDMDRLVRIEATSFTASGELSYPEYEEIVRSSPAFESVVAVGRRGVTLRRNGESHLLLIHYVSDNFFAAMGLSVPIGQPFSERSDTETTTPGVIVNHRLWRERLGARPDVLGSSIQLNDTLFTVEGVTAPGFVGLERIVTTDVWVRISDAPLVVPRLRNELADRHRRWFDVYGRLAPGVTHDQARVQLNTVASRWEQEDPEQYLNSALIATPLVELQRKAARRGIVILFLPALVLLIACANVANLVLAQTAGRRSEIALRTALGAGRGRLLRQLVAESFVIVSLGTILGLLAAAWLIQLFPSLAPPGAITLTFDTRFDLRVLTFSALLGIVSTSLVVLAAASGYIGADLAADLKMQALNPYPPRARFRTQHLIVAAQTALGVVVLAAAVLMVRSLSYSANLRAGFDSDKPVATFLLAPALRGYDPDATYRLLEELRQGLLALSEVRRASYGIRLPAQSNEAGWAADFVIPGKSPPEGRDSFRIRFTMVGPHYFDVLGTRILRGRGFDETDRPDSPHVAIVSETMAERLWAGQDPIGETVLMGAPEAVPRTIVGIAEDIKISDLYEAPEMYVYVPYAQNPQGFGLLMVETHNADEETLRSATAEITQIAPDVPILERQSFARHMEMVLFEERRDAAIASSIGLLALTLTTVGIYALVSMAARYRTREIGIRMVLGAAKRDVLYFVATRGLKPALIGCVFGMVGAFAMTRFLAGRLHGVQPHDAPSFAIGSSLLVFAAFLGSIVPALRASRRDPAQAIRNE